MSVEQYIDFHKIESDCKIMDLDSNAARFNDTDAKKVICMVSGCKSAAEFQVLEHELQNKYIKQLRKHGLSIQQISRLTGNSKGLIERIQDSEPVPMSRSCSVFYYSNLDAHAVLMTIIRQ